LSIPPQPSRRIAQYAELDAEHDALAAATGQRFSDQKLVVAAAVEIAGVDQVDPGIEGGAEGGDTFGAVRLAVRVGYAHGAQADARNRRAVFPERAFCDSACHCDAPQNG
jgi:hypothetical protein